MTWDIPVKDECPECGHTMFKKAGRGFKKPFCINESCPNFTPEEKRGGYRKKSASDTKADSPDAQKAHTEETTAESAPKRRGRPKKAKEE